MLSFFWFSAKLLTFVLVNLSTMKKTFLVAICTMMVFCHAAFAESWVDVTSVYLTNPNFDNNSNTGWTISSDAWSQNISYECQEFWNGTADIYQTATIPNGHYRLSVNAFYRPGNFDNSAASNPSGVSVNAVMYANETTQTLVSLYSEYLSSNYNNGCMSWNSQYYPNNMESASYAFGLGMYLNEMEFDVADNTVTFGMRNTENQLSNWMIMDNWKLEMYGDFVTVEDISLSAATTTLTVGQTVQITATITPGDALIQKLSWSSNNTDVATVDDNGTVTAVAEGSAIITASANDGSGTTATCTLTVETSTSGQSSLVITEVMVGNIDQYLDPSWNYGPWIEIYNPTSSAVTLTGMWLSENAADLQQAHISQPMAVDAGGYKVLWFDHHDKYCLTQVPMNLDADGGTIYLSDENGSRVASATYPAAISRCSYARKSVDGNEWGWTNTPTPGAANDSVDYQTLRLDAPVVDQPSQIYASNLTVCVNIPEGTTLRYTTDGSAPTATNGETSADGLFYPSGSTVVYRFALVADGYLPSEVVTRSYIYKDKDFALPTFSVVSEEANLWGDDYGIFVQGNGNGRAGNGQSVACNWNMDWERPANFEWLDADGEVQVNQEVHLERCGGWSRAWTPYSFKVKANKIYEGNNYFPYNFFTSKPYLRHKVVQVRNGGNDTSCRIKDPALQEIVRRSGLYVECQAYQPVMHYINGKYAGVINAREPNNKHYALANYGLDDDEIDQFEMSPDSGYVQKCGTYESMQKWMDLAGDCATSDEAYEEIKQMVDIDEFCNYMALEFWLACSDWPQNNVKAFKPIQEGGKFRFVLFDLDSAFGNSDPFNVFANKQTYTFDLLYGEDVSHITKEIELVTIFRNMLENEEFRKQFIDTYCLVSGSVFEPNRCSEIINELANNVSASMQISTDLYYTSTPWSTANSLISTLTSSRQTSAISWLKNYSAMGLSGETAQSVQLSTDIDEGRLLVNGLPVPTNAFNGQLFQPITLTAEAPAGYSFTGWQQVSGSTETSETMIDEGSTWSYYDQGSLDDEDWTSTSYSASNWSTGAAPLGYGKSQAATTLQSYLPTYYFRKNITLSSALASKETVTLNYTADDGFIVYVNGTEAARYNMPSGTATYDTFATTYAQDNPDTGSLTLSNSLFTTGENVVAVEVHNNSTSSSDILWEASLTRGQTTTEGTIVSTEPTFGLPTSSSDLQLVAMFTALTDEEKEEAGINTAPVVINEVSAANSVNVNEYYKKDDWVELYNTTDEDIDLEGMYITDHSNQPHRAQLSATGTNASTIIPAHGYKVVWCSSRTTDTELHVGFKLSNDGQNLVRLEAADGSWADSLVYTTMDGTQSMGRYPDGGTNVYLMNQTTIAESNRMDTYSVLQILEEDDTTDGVESMLASHDGGMSITYTQGTLLVKNEEEGLVGLTIHTPAGILMSRAVVSCEAGKAVFGVGALRPGTYIATATNSDGDRCAVKFIISQ